MDLLNKIEILLNSGRVFTELQIEIAPAVKIRLSLLL